MYIKYMLNIFNTIFTNDISFFNLKYKLFDDLIIVIEYIYNKKYYCKNITSLN